MSIISPASSRWSLPSRPPSPTSRNTVSASGASGSGRLGSRESASWSRGSVSANSASSALACPATSRICSIASPASSPDCLAAAMAPEASFWRARSASSSGSSSRRRASSSRTLSTASATSPPRRASAARTASGSRRISLTSSTKRRGRARLARARALRGRRLAARVLRQEVGDLLGVFADHDVLGHDRAGAAAVADRIEDLVGLLLALVEVRAVDALAVADVGGRALRAGVAERVTARAVLGEQDRAAVRALGLWHRDALRAARSQHSGGAERAQDADEAAAGHSGRGLYEKMPAPLAPLDPTPRRALRRAVRPDGLRRRQAAARAEPHDRLEARRVPDPPAVGQRASGRRAPHRAQPGDADPQRRDGDDPEGPGGQADGAVPDRHGASRRPGGDARRPQARPLPPDLPDRQPQLSRTVRDAGRQVGLGRATANPTATRRRSPTAGACIRTRPHQRRQPTAGAGLKIPVAW